MLWTYPFSSFSVSHNSNSKKKGAFFFVYTLFQTSLCAFMFGWHVHEKAVLVPVLLLALLAPADPRFARLFFWLSTIGHASLLPLFPPLMPEALMAWGLVQVHVCVCVYLLGKEGLLVSGDGEEEEEEGETGSVVSMFAWPEWVYLVGLEGVLLFVLVVHPLLLVERLPFLARMVSSVYCSVGMVVLWAWSYRLMALVAQEAEEEEEEEEEEKEEEKKVTRGRAKKNGETARAEAPAAAAAAAAARSPSPPPPPPQPKKKNTAPTTTTRKRAKKTSASSSSSSSSASSAPTLTAAATRPRRSTRSTKQS